MPDEPQDWTKLALTENPLLAFADILAAKWIDPALRGKLDKSLELLIVEAVKKILVTVIYAAKPVALGVAGGILEAKNEAGDVMQQFAGLAIRDIFGVELPAGLSGRPGQGGAREGIGRAVVDAYLQKLSPGAAGLEPSMTPARTFMGMAASVAFEAWLANIGMEMLSAVVPIMDQVQQMGQIGDLLGDALGLGRQTRMTIAPLLHTLVSMPLEQSLNRTYRPKMLPAGEVITQYWRGKVTYEEMAEQLAREGYGPKDIDWLQARERKQLTLDQVYDLMDWGVWDEQFAIEQLKQVGIDEQTTSKQFIYRFWRETQRWKEKLVDVAITAYLDRRITGLELDRVLVQAIPNARVRQVARQMIDVRFEMPQQRITPAQVAACVKADVLTVADYRRALQREGYPPDDVAALELLLRFELNREKAIAEHRKDQAEARAAEDVARAAAVEARRLAAEAEAAEARRGPVSDLTRAYVQGIIPRDRLAEVLAPDYDADTVEILLTLADEAREAARARQAAAEAAAARAGRREVPEGALRQAVLSGVLTLDDYRRRLQAAGLDAADVDLLADVVQTLLDDQARRRRERDEADRRARVRAISLDDVERLVRAGIRTREDYAATLRALGFVEGDVLDLVALLDQQLARDAAARAAQDAARETLAARGLSLSQLDRAVRLGVRDVAWYDAQLAAHGFDLDSREVLVSTLRAQLAEDDEARRRREVVETETAPRALPEAAVRRAAQLGIVSLDGYAAYLTAQGYREADVVLLVDLLTAEVGATQEARVVRDTVDDRLAAKGLSLATFERAVRAGVRTLDEYRTFLVVEGFDQTTVATLAALVAGQLDQAKAAAARRRYVLELLRAGGLDLDQVEADVVAGVLAIVTYQATLAGAGIDPADVAVLTDLLLTRLSDQAAAEAEVTTS